MESLEHLRAAKSQTPFKIGPSFLAYVLLDLRGHLEINIYKLLNGGAKHDILWLNIFMNYI